MAAPRDEAAAGPFAEAKAALSALYHRPRVERLAEHVARALDLWAALTGTEAPADLMDRVAAARAASRAAAAAEPPARVR